MEKCKDRTLTPPPSWISQNWKGCISVTLIVIMVLAEGFRWWINS